MYPWHRRNAQMKRDAPIVRFMQDLLDDEPWLTRNDLAVEAELEFNCRPETAARCAKRANYKDGWDEYGRPR